MLSVDGPLPGSDDIVSFDYDPSTGDLLAMTRPLVGAVTFSQYDGAGKPGRMTDQNGHGTVFSEWYFEWEPGDTERFVTISTEADGGSTAYTYKKGNLDTVSDPDGVTRAFSYEGLYGRVVRITEGGGDYAAYGYDAQGNIIEMSYHTPSGERTLWWRFDYQHPDLPGKLYRAVNPDGTFTQYGYDPEGKLTSINNGAVVLEYDLLGRLLSATQYGPHGLRHRDGLLLRQ
jgi:YD repeat-containing protein